MLQTSGRTASSSGLPTPSSKRNVGIGLSPKELKKSSLETMGEPVVGRTSSRRVGQLENALDDKRSPHYSPDHESWGEGLLTGAKLRTTKNSSHVRDHAFTTMASTNSALASDTVARSKCLATSFIKEGSRIFAEESFATVLLIREKGKRCDACFRLPSQGNHLKKCSGCGCYWYCDVQCMSDNHLCCDLCALFVD
jgi:hypothetical protein